MPREGKALPRNTQQIGGRAKTRTQVMSPEAERRREGGREECGEEKKKKKSREEKEEETDSKGRKEWKLEKV